MLSLAGWCCPLQATAVLQHWGIGSFLLLLSFPGFPPHIGVWAPGWAKYTLARQIKVRLPGQPVSGVSFSPVPASRGMLW